MTRQRRVSAPANLLLMGEYAVLEEGGLGVALAPDIRVRGTLIAARSDGAAVQPGVQPGMCITGHMPGKDVHWPGDPGVMGLAADYLQSRFPVETGVEITLDSLAFFDSAGRKRGLGSSASIVVALAALWPGAAGGACPDGECETGGQQTEPTLDHESIFRIALEAHRLGQGGRGSGYDVACSTYGGITVFTGGSRPTARRITLSWLPDIRLLQGEHPVRTVSAVAQYTVWKRANPGDAAAFLDDSNRLVTEFTRARDWETAREILGEYRDLTLRLGETIGVAAVFPHDGDNAAQAFVKAVGAGNELAVSISGSQGIPVAIGEGLAWQ